MATVAEFKREVIRLLGDTVKVDDANEEVSPVSGDTTSTELLLDACHAALRAVASRQWKSSIFEIAEAGEEFELPLDVIEIDAVLVVAMNMFIPKMIFTQGIDLGSLSSEGNSWIDAPNGLITFSNTLAASGAKIYYSAHWTLPSDDEDVLESPEICLTAMVLYGASYCLLRTAAEQAKLGAVKTKVDSGSPEDIPSLVMSNGMLKRFEIELSRIPMKQKGTQ